MGIWLQRERIDHKRANTGEFTSSNEVVVHMNAIAITHPSQIKMPRLFRSRQEPIQLTTMHSPTLEEVSSNVSSSFSSDDELNMHESTKGEYQQVRFSSTLVYHELDEAGEWYTKQELKEILTTRLEAQQILSRGLDRRSERSYGKVLFRMLMRLRKTPSEEDSFQLDTTDFALLERYSLKHDELTGMERTVTEAVASETRALMGTVQQSVLMVQEMIRGEDNAAECIRVASLRYSSTSQRLARALGEVHAVTAKRS